MTKNDYASWLLSLIGQDRDDTLELRDQFYGYFQAFMPSGHQVDQVFAPLPEGAELYQRLQAIFLATESVVLEALSQGKTPGYFVPRPQEKMEALQAVGREWLESLKLFAEFIANQELAEQLQQVIKISISGKDEQVVSSDLQLDLLDAFSDWHLEAVDDDQLISVLDEAYYSINCDYFLSAYLQYPSYRDKPDCDFLKPYFNLWQLGYQFVLLDEELRLFPYSF